MPDENMNLLDYAGLTYYNGKLSSRIATKAEKTALASTDREVALIRRAIEGQLMEIEEDHTEAYSKTLPSGVIGVGVNMIGGKSIIMNQLVVLDAPTRTYNGITKTNNSDGTYTFNGTCTAGFSDLFDVYANEIRVDAGDIVYATFTANKSLPEGANVRLYISGSIATQSVTISENGNIITLNQTAKTSLCLRINEGSVLDNLTITVKLINLTKAFGATKAAAMTVDTCKIWFPKPTYTASEGYVLSADCDKVVSEGKNLCVLSSDKERMKDHCTYAIDGNSINVEAEGKYSRVAFLLSEDIEIGESYTVSVEEIIGNADFKRIYLMSNDDSFGFDYGQITSTVKQITFTATTRKLFLGFYVTAESESGNMNVKNIQAEKGSTATSYSPYMTDSFPIPQGLRQDYPLRSAGDVHDEYDFTRKKFVKRVNSVDLGDLTWTAYNTSTYPALWYTNIDDRVDDIGCKCLPEIIEYNFYAYTARSSWNGVRDNDKSVCKAAVNASYPKRLWINDSDFVGKTSAQVAEIIAGKILIYEKETPTEIDITSYFPEGFSPLLTAEAGGSITFHQNGDTMFPVPNSTDYFVKTTPTVA